MIDFPNAPTLNQQFNASNGATYQWDGTVWIPIGTSSVLLASDTPPASPATNQLWFNSLMGQLFIWFNDGNSSQWVPASPVPTYATTTPSLLLHLSTATVTAVNGTSTTVTWDVTTENTTGGTYSAGTFTMPAAVAGLWEINCGIQGINTNANVSGIATLFVNSVATVNASSAYIGGSNTGTTPLNLLYRFLANDAIRVGYHHNNTGGTYYGTTGAIRNSWFHLTRVGA